MTTARDRILAYLSQHSEGATDADLTAALDIKYVAQTNKRCLALAAEGLLERRKVDGRYRNFFGGSPARDEPPSPAPAATHRPAGERPWFWEGHVQSAVVTYLAGRGDRIIRVADTASRQRGKDIVAENARGRVWVTVKGFPEGRGKAQPSAQAGVWFSQAVFDVVAYRSEDPAVQLALALPDFPRYRTLAERVRWLMPVVPFRILWVGEDGCVTEDCAAGG